MQRKQQEVTIEAILDLVRAVNPDKEALDLIQRAFLYASEKHKTQLRKSG